MALTINTNQLSLNTQRNLRKSESPLNSAMERLSSGLRINSAKDDAAGLAIATRMDAQVRGLSVAIRNANDGLSFAQTAEGAISEMVSDVERIYELAVQSSSYNTKEDRSSMNVEVKELIDELDRVVTQTRFGGEQFLNKQISWSYQVGTKVDETITLNTRNLSPTALGVTTTYSENFDENDVAMAAWSTYDSGLKNRFNNKIAMNGVQLGGAIKGAEILNNSKILIDRINKYSSDTKVLAMSYGNALIAKDSINIISNGIAAASGFMTINGVAIGSLVRSEVSKEDRNRARAETLSKDSDIINAKRAELEDKRDEIEADYLTKIQAGKIKRAEDQKDLTDKDLATALTDQYIETEPVEQRVQSKVQEKIAFETAINISVVINDKSTETGVKANVVSNARLVLSNRTGAGINISIDESRFISEKGDAAKDITIGFGSEGASVDGGQNGLIVLTDKRFGVGSVMLKDSESTALFGFGTVTFNGETKNLQGKRDISESIALSKKSVAGLSIDTADNSKLTMMVTEEVLDLLNAFKSTLGAKMNRMESTIRNLDNVRENITAAKSRILDADFASETANLTKAMILQQAGISILSQANTMPQNVLALMRG